MSNDAPDQHVYLPGDPIGGFVCSVCFMPTESEPCEFDQPSAHAGGPEPDRLPGSLELDPVSGWPVRQAMPELRWGDIGSGDPS